MWPSHPLQRHVCATLLLLGGITSLVYWKSKNLSRQNSFDASSNGSDLINEVFSIDQKLVVSKHKGFKGYKNYFTIPKMKHKSDGVRVKEIYILGLFELSTKWGRREEGFSEMAAARLAVNHVNSFRILPGYLLKLITNDTKCDPGVGVDRFFHALYSNKIILMLLGAGCSNVSESLANIVPYWNILQVSFGSTSPVLSDRTKFPLFFRTVAPDSSHNTARISFIKHFGWNTVATLTLSQQPYLLSLNNFVNELEAANVTCVATITFSLDNFKEQMRVLKASKTVLRQTENSSTGSFLQELDTRIIIGSFSAQIAPRIFCEAYNLEMYGKDYIWILQDQNVVWWRGSHECHDSSLHKSTEGLILVSDYILLSNNETSISGLQTNKGFEEKLRDSNVSISQFAPQTYDAIWAMALTLRNVVACKQKGFLANFSYKDAEMVKRLLAEMEVLGFVGISGPVKFSGADRVGNSAFKQVQGGNLRDIAIYYAESNFLDFQCRGCFGIRWQGGQIPIAQRILKFRLLTIPKLAFFVVFCFSSIGIATSLVFLYFNLHFRRVRAVKLSSPRLNNIVVLGCILVYIAVILLGVDHATVFFQDKFTQFCTVRVYLLSAGFSLTFGSIFAKTYRVHRIFTYSGASLVKDKLLKDKQLIGLIFVLLVIDGMIVLLWVIVDPMERKLRNLPLEMSLTVRGIVYQPQVEVCRSQNTTGWFIAIYSYKGFLLIVSVYMAWETRHVKIPFLNDSQYIGICVYSVVSSAIVVVLANFLADYITLSYLATTLSILLSTTITLALLFLPKLRAVLGRVDGEDTIMQSMGLKIECNTRRFIFNDHRELLYRMEVQNRVYRSELHALDKEIARLEELLASPAPTSPESDHLSIAPYTISNGVFLPVFSAPTEARASWPSTTGVNNDATSKEFLSDDKLHGRASNGSTILDKLRRFFGSIPSVWMSSSTSADQVVVDGVVKEKPSSNPEFCTNSLIAGFGVVKANSAMSALDRADNADAAFVVNFDEGETFVRGKH